MYRTSLFLTLAAASVSPAALAQHQLDPNLNPRLQPAPRIATDNTGVDPMGGAGPQLAWGAQQGVTWISATKFNRKLTATDSDLQYAGQHFYSSPGGGIYFAQLDVEPGKRISHLTCIYNDPSAIENISFQWQKYTTDLISGSTSNVVLDNFTSAGTPGVEYEFINFGGNELMEVFDVQTNSLVNHQIRVDVGTSTSFAGCYAFWRREVAPGPATATFNDVPTTSPFFKFVEAVNESGVTSGCGNGNYCPNAPITRAQMAVFLAQALGMGYPY